MLAFSVDTITSVAVLDVSLPTSHLARNEAEEAEDSYIEGIVVPIYGRWRRGGMGTPSPLRNVEFPPGRSPSPMVSEHEQKWRSVKEEVFYDVEEGVASPSSAVEKMQYPREEAQAFHHPNRCMIL